MPFCQVCGRTHFDDTPLCDPEVYHFGKIITEANGKLAFEPPGDWSEGCRSENGNDAENEGRMPLTRAIPIVAHHAHCTRGQAKAALSKTHEGEWHHAGLFSRRVNYYSIAAAVAFLRRAKK